LLLSGEIDAAVGDVRADSPDIKPLIPNAREAGYAWFGKTGIYPLNHGVVISNAVLEAEPWVAEALFDAFKAARQSYRASIEPGKKLSTADQTALALGSVVGGDPFPFGVAANRKALEAIVRFSLEQHAIAKTFSAEELFV